MNFVSSSTDEAKNKSEDWKNKREKELKDVSSVVLSIMFLKLKRKYTEDILGIKEAKRFVPKQISAGFIFIFLFVLVFFFFLQVSLTCL